MFASLQQIQSLVGHDGGHTCSTFGRGQVHAVHTCLYYSRKRGHSSGDFRTCNILTLPAEGIADPIHEIKVAAFINPHEVPGAVPGIAALEHVAKDLAF